MTLHRASPAQLERARTEEMQAKHPVSRASGPYGHPFHPIFVTIPNRFSAAV
jgi:hypothetical protein